MKRFVINHLVVAALVVSAALMSSCGKDDNGDKIKLLETITSDWGDDGYGVTKFEYDDQNRIIKISGYWDGKLEPIKTLNYGDDWIKVTWLNYDEYGDRVIVFTKTGNNTITLSTNADGYIETLTIDNDGYLSKWVDVAFDDNRSQEVTFQYQNGNLTKMTNISLRDGKKGFEEVFEFKYDDKKSPFYHCKTPKWFMQFWFFFDDIFGIGFKNNIIELIGFGEEIGYSNFSFSIEYIYEYDSDGFPTKQTSIEYEDGEVVNTRINTFTYITR